VYELIRELSLPVLEEALHCLYHDHDPENPELQELDREEWLALAEFLHKLMLEKLRSKLH
jgi:hypothetical protein